MKKLFLVSIIVLGVLTAANAQFYAGAGFSVSSSSISASSNLLSFGVNLSPEFGLMITPKVSLGTNFNIRITGTDSSSDSYTSTTTEYYYEFAPYVRYGVIRYNNFVLQLQGDVYVSYLKRKAFYNDYHYPNGNKQYFGLRVAPRLSYDISRHFTLYTKLDFLGLRFTTFIDREQDEVQTSFSLFGNTSNIISLDGLSIGMLYVF
jgi:hypothetical protein